MRSLGMLHALAPVMDVARDARSGRVTETLRQADAPSALRSNLAQLQRPHLLIADEAGHLPLDRADANRVLQVINRRHTRVSTIIASNKTVSEWADI